MIADQRAMYTGLAMCRNTEVQMRWARSNFFLLIHSGGVSLLVARLGNWTFLPLLCASVLGFLLGLAWTATILRTNQRVKYWQTRLRVFEQSRSEEQAQPGEQVEVEMKNTQVFSGDEWDKIEKFRLNFRSITMLLALAFTLAWAALFIWNLATH